MQERIRWGQPALQTRGIDQTQFVLDHDQQPSEQDGAFHFLVVGDSGTGRHRLHSPPRRIAERLLEHKQDAAFLLHTGDVVYLVGATAQYQRNFIRPYREWLVDGMQWETVSPKQLTFNQPFLPVPGNHDYYDLAFPIRLVAGLTLPFRQHLQWFHDVDAGWRGSRQGEAYARAFLDVLHDIPAARLAHHLDKVYSAEWNGRRCLRYRPGVQTSLPNRYYRFRHAGVDVFAIDSNTLIAPLKQSDNHPELIKELKALKQEQAQRFQELASLRNEEARDGVMDELETLQEELLDRQRRLNTQATVDHEQLQWLRDGLIESHQDPSSRGRIAMLHHPPYVSEKTKWNQADTQAIRHRLREVLDDVAKTIGQTTQPLIDVVMSGHAHCLEVLRSHETGHADRNLHWVICGGSGYGLRPQRRDGAVLEERNRSDQLRPVASSELFIGRNWRNGMSAYSGLRVDVSAGRPLRIQLTPLVSYRDNGCWHDAELATINLPMHSNRTN